MTALGKLFRTTAFKLTLVYLTVFALFAAFLLVYFAWNTRRLITEQITQTVDAEITGLAEQYRQGGIRRLVFVDRCARRAGRARASICVTTSRGRGACRQCRLARHRRPRTAGLDARPPIAGSRTPMAPSTTRWCGCSNCPAAFGCWSDAISKSASGSTISCSPPAAGRSRSWSCSASPAASS